MTREQFLEVLADLHRKGLIVGKLEDREEGRGTILLRKPSEPNFDFSTGTVVVFVAKLLAPDKPGWLCMAYVNAGKEIDLSPEDATALDRAGAKAQYLDGHDPELRVRMLTILGLTELVDEVAPPAPVAKQETTAA
jgi:hypothetical protein